MEWSLLIVNDQIIFDYNESRETRAETWSERLNGWTRSAVAANVSCPVNLSRSLRSIITAGDVFRVRAFTTDPEECIHAHAAIVTPFFSRQSRCIQIPFEKLHFPTGSSVAWRIPHFRFQNFILRPEVTLSLDNATLPWITSLPLCKYYFSTGSADFSRRGHFGRFSNRKWPHLAVNNWDLKSEMTFPPADFTSGRKVWFSKPEAGSSERNVTSGR